MSMGFSGEATRMSTIVETFRLKEMCRCNSGESFRESILAESSWVSIKAIIKVVDATRELLEESAPHSKGLRRGVDTGCHGHDVALRLRGGRSSWGVFRGSARCPPNGIKRNALCLSFFFQSAYTNPWCT